MGDFAVLDTAAWLADDAANYKTVIPSATFANTKGAWTQVVAALGFDSTLLMVEIQQQDQSGSSLLDIGIGPAGSEVVIVPNLLTQANSANNIVLQSVVPIVIPAGTRVAARDQTNFSGTTNVYLSTKYGRGGFPRVPGFGRVTDYGTAVGSSRGTTTTAGAIANTFGAWTQLVASSANPVRWAIVIIGDALNAAAAVDIAVDIGVGAAGSEISIGPLLYVLSQINTIAVVNGFFSFPVSIPAGTRIAVRSKASTASRTCDVALYGVD